MSRGEGKIRYSSRSRRPVFSGTSRPVLALLYCSFNAAAVSQGAKPRSPIIAHLARSESRRVVVVAY